MQYQRVEWIDLIQQNKKQKKTSGERSWAR
jgi:hypothetical protein